MSGEEARLPEGPLVAWYGDDFTGAAAVMEALAFSGVPAALFLDAPTPERLARFPGLRAIGLASTARTWAPERMARELPAAFAALRALNPAILHYKVCSTLDSAPEIGSIGKAMEIGADLCGASLVPVLIAAPQMRRYQCFGHLFAGAGAGVFRLDRHPVMSRHPVTPMNEADVALHIARQSERIDAGCVTLEELAEADLRRPARSDGRIEALTLDSVDAASEAGAGRLIWEARDSAPFVVGSQGVEYALVRHWRAKGWLAESPKPGGIGRAPRTIVVSGSVSPVTAAQIAWSGRNGFALIPFDAAAAAFGGAALEAEIARARAAALVAIGEGRDPLIHTAAGPDDSTVARFRDACARAGGDAAAINRQIGESLGDLLAALLAEAGPARVIVSGGDTSGFATGRLGLFALTALAPTIPGAAIFRAHAEGATDGLEIALKGGQMGAEDYFGEVRNGGG